MIADGFGVRPPRSVPYAALKGAAFAGDAVKRLGLREPPITSFRLDNLLADMVYDTRETEGLVGPLPFDLKDGVEATISWMLQSEGSAVRSNEATT